MILTEYLTLPRSRLWSYAMQAGVTHATVRAPDKDFDPTDYGQFADFHQQYTSIGLTPVVLEPMPNSLHDHIKAGDAKRDECIEKVIRMMEILDRLNLRVICTNFMAYIGWCRTRNDLPERGGALVTGFDRAACPDAEPLRITQETLWENLRYFLEAILPAAERHGIRIALHPDDPPVPRLKDVERILISRKAIDRALALVSSPAIGITLCQGCYAAMGESVSRQHTPFRGYGESCSSCISVTWREQRTVFARPSTITARLIWRRQSAPTGTAAILGPSGWIMYRQWRENQNDTPGYAGVGRLYALGYLKGLLEGAGHPYE